MGHGSGKKYCVKWTNLREELECEYGAGHNLFKDPAAVRPQKQLKIHNQPAVVPSPDRSSGTGLHETDGGELYLSDSEVSEPDVQDPQIPGISPLLVGENQWSPQRPSAGSCRIGWFERVLLASSARARAHDITRVAPRTTGPNRTPAGATRRLGPPTKLPCACPRHTWSYSGVLLASRYERVQLTSEQLPVYARLLVLGSPAMMIGFSK